MVLGICLLTDLIIVLSYSDVQSRNLQLHDEQITNQKSDEGNLKVRTPRAKNRKSPYQFQASAQHPPITILPDKSGNKPIMASAKRQ